MYQIKFTVTRNHSLYGIREKLSDCLECIAETEEGVVRYSDADVKEGGDGD